MPHKPVRKAGTLGRTNKSPLLTFLLFPPILFLLFCPFAPLEPSVQDFRPAPDVWVVLCDKISSFDAGPRIAVGRRSHRPCPLASAAFRRPSGFDCFVDAFLPADSLFCLAGPGPVDKGAVVRSLCAPFPFRLRPGAKGGPSGYTVHIFLRRRPGICLVFLQQLSLLVNRWVPPPIPSLLATFPHLGRWETSGPTWGPL